MEEARRGTAVRQSRQEAPLSEERRAEVARRTPRLTRRLPERVRPGLCSRRLFIAAGLVTDPYDRPMPVLWSCPNPDCPPTKIAPVDVPESGERTGAEAERSFTADQVAALLNVPLDTIAEWHTEGTGPAGYQSHKESHYRRSDVVRWLSGARGIARYLPERMPCDLPAKCIHDGGGQRSAALIQR